MVNRSICSKFITQTDRQTYKTFTYPLSRAVKILMNNHFVRHPTNHYVHHGHAEWLVFKIHSTASPFMLVTFTLYNRWVTWNFWTDWLNQSFYVNQYFNNKSSTDDNLGLNLNRKNNWGFPKFKLSSQICLFCLIRLFNFVKIKNPLNVLKFQNLFHFISILCFNLCFTMPIDRYCDNRVNATVINNHQATVDTQKFYLIRTTVAT